MSPAKKPVRPTRARRAPKARTLLTQNPEAMRITPRQAKYLAKRTGIRSAEIAKLTVAEAQDKLRWRLDPILLGYQRVCGRVVHRDPTSGDVYPVPFAVVHVEDTDCSLLFHAPPDYGYVWIYPGGCHREEIATVQADGCGNFCVWIPRWDVDMILRWRRERICFPILERPRIIDLLEGLVRIPDIPRPVPLPDPPPDFSNVSLRREIEVRLGAGLTERLERLAPERTFGGFRGSLDKALLEPAPRELLPKPPQPNLKELPSQQLKALKLESLQVKSLIGPFKVCRDVIVPEWQFVLDVPDVTFRVTQQQGGSDVTIYDEGFFDVRWNETSIPDVTLEAWPNAQWVEICGEGPGIVCQNQPAILNISEMPLTSGYHDNTGGDPTFGYGIRVNQPSPDGIVAPSPGPLAGEAQAPYADRLNFYGCFHIQGSTHYRVVAAFEGGPQQPVTGVSFPVLTNAFTVDHQTPDPDGWYPIRNDLISSYEHLILPWPTQQTRFPDGTYQLVLQVGKASGGGMTVNASSTPPIRSRSTTRGPRRSSSRSVGGTRTTAPERPWCFPPFVRWCTATQVGTSSWSSPGLRRRPTSGTPTPGS